jgi:exportin-5
LWEVPDSAVHKELVMFILENLSDEVFTGDDSVVAMREGVLSKACVEIFTPTSVLVEAFPNRQPGPPVRYGDDGWLSRLSQFLGYCLNSAHSDNDEVKLCIHKGLSVFLSLMPWAIPKAVSSARCVEVLCVGLASSHASIQKVTYTDLRASEKLVAGSIKDEMSWLAYATQTRLLRLFIVVPHDLGGQLFCCSQLAQLFI